MKKVVVISGLSGAGKSTSLGFFEDSGYFCMDNVPSVILENIVSLLVNSSVEKSAMVVDIRSEAFGEPHSVLERLKKTHPGIFSIIFLEASTESIVRRYALTRRKHPLLDVAGSVERAIEMEKEMLREIKDLADHVIDTTSLNSHQLREKLRSLLDVLEEAGVFTFRLESFGYKYGIPVDADFVFDTRFFPNPYYDPNLSERTGLDPEVAEFFEKYPEIGEYADMIVGVLMKAKEGYEREGRNSVSVAIGCTGGKHRSVYITEKVAKVLRDMGEKVTVEHRDVMRG